MDDRIEDEITRIIMEEAGDKSAEQVDKLNEGFYVHNVRAIGGESAEDKRRW